MKKDKWVVIARCSNCVLAILKDGEIAFDFDMAVEIAKEHQDIGAEIELIRYSDYKEIYE